MILGMANKSIPWTMGLAVFGMILLYFISRETDNKNPKLNQESETELREKTPFEIYEGYGMILMAAFTEACIYFLVRDLKTTNQWNHLFLSYFFGSLIFTGYFSTDIFKNVSETNIISISLILNTVIGLFGHLLRFYSMSHLTAELYAPLSYFGIVMATIYGILFNQESVNGIKLLGIVCILLSNIITAFVTKNREI